MSRALKKLSDRALEIRYEDLISDPEKEVKKVCEFLGISYQKRMLEFYKSSNKFIDDEHSNLIFSPIESRNKFKWKREMSVYEIKCFNFFSKYMLDKYRYEQNYNKYSLFEVIQFLKELMIYLPKRILKIAGIAIYISLASRLGLPVSKKYYD